MLRYATWRCAAGLVFVAVSARGVRHVWLGRTARELVDTLRREPGACCLRCDPRLRTLAQLIWQKLRHPVRLPLDLRGTPFQRRVWRALRRIRPGTTVTYAELAGRVGRPSAVRAVARACAANPLALLIPCHRVVRSDGKLGGYRWGAARKRLLLEFEARRRCDPPSGHPVPFPHHAHQPGRQVLQERLPRRAR